MSITTVILEPYKMINPAGLSAQCNKKSFERGRKIAQKRVRYEFVSGGLFTLGSRGRLNFL